MHSQLNVNDAKLVTIHGYMVKYNQTYFFTDDQFNHRSWIRTAKTGETLNHLEWGRLQRECGLKKQPLTKEERKKAAAIAAEIEKDPWYGLTVEEKNSLEERGIRMRSNKTVVGPNQIVFEDKKNPITLRERMKNLVW